MKNFNRLEDIIEGLDTSTFNREELLKLLYLADYYDQRIKELETAVVLLKQKQTAVFPINLTFEQLMDESVPLDGEFRNRIEDLLTGVEFDINETLDPEND